MKKEQMKAIKKKHNKKQKQNKKTKKHECVTANTIAIWQHAARTTN